MYEEGVKKNAMVVASILLNCMLDVYVMFAFVLLVQAHRHGTF